jgi:hypothetical protein
VQKAGTLRFKIIPVCKELIAIDHDFKGKYVPVDYDAFDYPEIDARGVGGRIIRYFEPMTKQAILENPAWLALVEDDKDFLKEYADITLELKSANMKGMAFHLPSKEPDDDALWPLAISTAGLTSEILPDGLSVPEVAFALRRTHAPPF